MAAVVALAERSISRKDELAEDVRLGPL